LKDFYYQIKGQGKNSFGSSWSWPPIFSGMVNAKDKKAAKTLIEDEYGRAFPLRVLKKDVETQPYLMNIREIDKDDELTHSLFDTNTCKQCEIKFRVIDKYNDPNMDHKGADFCSYKCRTKYYEDNKSYNPIEDSNDAALIYKITKKSTGMSYVGKTTQVFTLRWYQHFFQNKSDCKFYQSIKDSVLTDWEFSLLESVEVIRGEDTAKRVTEREDYWIKFHDCIDNGYNSVSAIAKPIKRKTKGKKQS